MVLYLTSVSTKKYNVTHKKKVKDHVAIDISVSTDINIIKVGFTYLIGLHIDFFTINCTQMHNGPTVHPNPVSDHGFILNVELIY